MMDCQCVETRVPRITWYGTELADYLVAAGVPLELADYDKRTDETVVIWREPAEGDEAPDVAKLLADFVPGPPPPTRDELIAAATTLAQLKAALLGGG